MGAPSLEALIAAAGSQAKLAKLAGVTTSTVRSWRAAGSIPPLRLRRLRRHLPDVFAGGNGYAGPVQVSAPHAPSAPRDGKPRGVYAPDVAPPPVASAPSAASEEEPIERLGSPAAAARRLGSAVPEWAHALTDRLGLPLSAAKTITSGESKSLRPTVIRALERLWDLLDTGISHTNARHADAVIWTTTSDEATAKIADLLLRNATRSIGAAVLVRALNDAYERYEVLAVLGINSYRSLMHYWLNGGFTLAFRGDLLSAIGALFMGSAGLGFGAVDVEGGAR